MVKRMRKDCLWWHHVTILRVVISSEKKWWLQLSVLLCKPSTFYCSTLLFHPIVPPYGYTLWLHPMVTPYGYTLWLHPMVTPYGYTLWLHPMVTPYGYTLLLLTFSYSGVSWPSGLAYRTQVLVLAAECGFESRPWHLCPWARHLIIIASLHPGVKWVPVRAELVD